MDEYIGLKKLLAKIDEAFFETDPDGKEQIGVLKCRAIIRKIPAADVAPVVHGRWIVRFGGPYNRRRCYCSHCGKHNGVGGIAKNQEKPYCPNCGAKMDGGDSDATD